MSVPWEDTQQRKLGVFFMKNAILDSKNIDIKIEKLKLEELPWLIASQVSKENYSFFLDSSNNPNNLGRYSFIGCSPFLVFQSYGTKIKVSTADTTDSFEGNPISYLQEILSKFNSGFSVEIPFIGGGVGYLSYDLGRFIEKVPFSVDDDLKMPEIYFCFYDQVLVFDHLKEEYSLVTASNIMDRYPKAKLAEYLNNTNLYKDNHSFSKQPEKAVGRRFQSNFSHPEYLKAVNKALEYIRAGDIYQVNLSQRFSIDVDEEPYKIYSILRQKNPAPFSAFLKFPEFTILSTSPERFILKKGQYIQTRPIKGTRPRHKNKAIDKRLAEELINSEKDRAENVMIVDLERNDLGKICQFGQVKVTKLFGLESFASVHHLVSEIEGKLKSKISIEEIIRATFPGGSITGAPKIRAMEIIDELEPTARAIYTGSIGYFGFNQNIDLNIVIRTVIYKNGKLIYQVGGGIVADSDPEGEFQETLDKGLAIKAALEEIISQPPIP